jgi:purine-nucleoside phosphorylase
VVAQQWNSQAKTADQAVGVIKAVTNKVPDAAVVLGSGAAALHDLLHPIVLPFEEIFGIAPTVAGHAGSVTVGQLPEKPSVTVAVIRGRYHVYEGHDYSTLTLATKTMVGWGVPRLFLTNAAGGVNSQFDVGDLMVITAFRDLLNPKYRDTGLLEAAMAPAVASENALTASIIKAGQHLASQDKEFRSLRTGTYCGFSGPSYETLAEIEMARRLKIDAVGMSTVPELQAAAGTGTVAAALSVITNVWSDDKPMGGHEEVLEASKHASRRLDQLFRYLLQN